MYVCMVITYSRVGINPARSWSAEQGNYPYVPENLSRETGLAVPSRVSLLISILRLNLVLTYAIPPESSDGSIGKVINPAQGQLNKEHEHFFPVPVCA